MHATKKQIVIKFLLLLLVLLGYFGYLSWEFDLVFTPGVYQTTIVTSLFEKIISTPWPYWSIILLSGIGTFLSIRFGDELMDVASHKDRKFHHKHGFIYSLILYAGIFALIFIGYHHVAVSLSIENIIR